MENKKEKKVEKKVEVSNGSNCGSNIRIPLKWKWSDKDRQMIPYYDEADVVDVYKQIQAAAGSCDIVSIYQRALLGDTSIINLANPVGWPDSDVSDVPNNINDMYEMQKAAYNDFDNLDPKVKEIFGNNKDNFIQAVQNGSYISMVANAFKNESQQKGKENEESEENK